MSPYFIFISFLFYFFLKKSPKAMLWTLIIFASIRYEVGWDYASYVAIVNNQSTWENAEISRYSLIWRELFKFAYYIGSPHIAIIIPNILTYICLYLGLKSLNLNKQEISGALFVYATWYSLYLNSFSIIRQSIAMSIGLLLFAYVQNKQFLKSLILYALAVLLHPSSAVLFIIYPIYFVRTRLNFRWIIISIAILFMMLFSLKNILFLLSFLDMEQYELYLNWDNKYGGKIIYVNVLLTLYLMYVFSISKYKDDIKRQCYVLAILSLSGNIIVYFIGLPEVISRVFLYFIIFMIVILLPSVNIFRYNNNLRLLSSVVLIIFFFLYLYITRSGADIASSGYLPYKTIFFF